MTLRYAIVGCGAAGKVHAYHFSRDPRIGCVAAIDTDRERTDWFAGHFGFTHQYTTLEEAFGIHDIDVVSIATPPVFHARQIEAAAESGCDILSEKPLVLSHEEAVRAIDVCQKNGVKLGVMLPRRFYNNSIAVRQVLAEGKLGEIIDVSFTLECRKEKAYYDCWRGQKKYVGGGVLMSQAIHSIDQLVFFFGKPAKVDGKVWKTRDYIDVEDEATARIEFENGVTASVSATNNSPDHEWRGLTTITGTKGKIVLDSADVLCWDVEGVENPRQEEGEDVPEIYKPKYYGPGHRKVIASFIDSLSTGNAPRVSAKDTLPVLDLIWKVYDQS